MPAQSPSNYLSSLGNSLDSINPDLIRAISELRNLDTGLTIDPSVDPDDFPPWFDFPRRPLYPIHIPPPIVISDDLSEILESIRDRYRQTPVTVSEDWKKILRLISGYIKAFNKSLSEENYVDALNWLYSFFDFMEVVSVGYETDRNAFNFNMPELKEIPVDFEWRAFYNIEKVYLLIKKLREKLSLAVDGILKVIQHLGPEEQKKKWLKVEEFTQVVDKTVHSFVWVYDAHSRLFRGLQLYIDAFEAIGMARTLCEKVEAGPVTSIVSSWIISAGNVGDIQYLSLDKRKAENTYGQIAKWTDTGVVMGDALAAAGEVFETPRQNVAKVIEKINQLSTNPNALQELIEEDGSLAVGISLDAITALKSIIARQIALSGDVIGAGALRVTPVWRFDTLLNLATYFSNQSKYAEQRYFGFQESLQNRKITNQQLNDAVVVAKNEFKLADIRADQARLGLRIARQRTGIADTRSSQTAQQYWTYSSKSLEAVEHQMYAAALGGGSDAIYKDIMKHVNRLRKKGKTRGKTGLLVGANTYIAGMASREVELERLRHARELAAKEREMVETQERAAGKEALYANVYASAVGDRVRAAEAMATIYANQPLLNEEAYAYMANIMKEIAQSYYMMALDVARAAEQAFNFEFRIQSNLFADSVIIGHPSQLLESERLLQNLASLKNRELSLGDVDKNILEWVIDLKALSPATFIENLNTHRPFEFSLSDADIAQRFPGLVDVRLERLELDVITIGANSINENAWTLSNGAIGAYINAQTLKLDEKLQNSMTHTFGYTNRSSKPITTRLSEGEADKRRPFEGISPLCNWQFRLNPVKNIDANTTATLRLFVSGSFNEDRYQQDINVVAHRRLSPVALAQFAPEDFAELIANRKANFELPFSVEADDIRYALFDESSAAFPKLVKLAVAMRDEEGIMQENLTLEVTPPMGNQRIISISKGIGDIMVDDNIPAVGVYQIVIPEDVDDRVLNTIQEILFVPSFVMTPFK